MTEMTEFSFESATVPAITSSAYSGDWSLGTLNDRVSSQSVTTHDVSSPADPRWMSIIIIGVPSLAACVVVACIIIFAIKKLRIRKPKQSIEEKKLALEIGKEIGTVREVSLPDENPDAYVEPDFHAYEDVAEPAYCEILATLDRSAQSCLMDSGDYEEMTGGTLAAKIRSLTRKRFLAEAQRQSSNSAASTCIFTPHAAKPPLDIEQGLSDDPLITSPTQLSSNENSSQNNEVKYANIVDLSTSKTVPYSIVEFPFAGQLPHKVSPIAVSSASGKSSHDNEKPKADIETPDSDYTKLGQRPDRKPRIYTRLTEIFRPRPNKRSNGETSAAKEDI